MRAKKNYELERREGAENESAIVCLRSLDFSRRWSVEAPAQECLATAAQEMEESCARRDPAGQVRPSRRGLH